MHYLIILLLITFCFLILKRLPKHKFTFYKQPNKPIDITDEAAIACHKCGKFHHNNSAVCPHCGADLKTDD